MEVSEIDIGEGHDSERIEAEIEYEQERWNQGADNIQVPLATPAPPVDSQDTVTDEPAAPTPAGGVSAHRPPILLMDLKSVTSKTELAERLKVNKEVNELIVNAKAHDKKQHATGDYHSDLAGEIIRYLVDIRDEYSNLLKISAKLETPSMEEIKIQLAKRKHVMDQPGVEVLDDTICVPLQRSSDSLALRRMLNIIYSKHIFQKYQINFIQGPICRPTEAPPKIEEMYFTNKPSK